MKKINNPKNCLLVGANGRLGRILSWYDNEWGFANRMSDAASFIGKLIN